MYLHLQFFSDQSGMNSPSINLRRSLDLTMRDTLLRIKNLGGKDSQPLKEEFREWLDASSELDKHPHVLYISQINPSSKNDH